MLIEYVALKILNTYIFFVLTRIPSTFITRMASTLMIHLAQTCTQPPKNVTPL